MSKKKALLAVAGTLVVIGTVAAVSQPGPRWHRERAMMHGEWGGRFGGLPGMGPAMRLKALDTDKDGTVTLAEFVAPQEKRFGAIDKNNDGVIDAAEAGAMVRERVEFAFKALVHRLDRDKDGKITAEEFRRSARERFMMRDLDGDGRITESDLPPGMRERMAEWKSRRDARRGAEPPDAKGPDAKGPDVKAPDTKDRADDRRGWRLPMTLERALAARDGAFKRFDRNGDGTIDQSEIEAAVAERVDYWTRRFMHRFDQNRDGKVTKDEFTRPARERFAGIDLNDDGRITEDDLAPWMRGRGILK